VLRLDHSATDQQQEQSRRHPGEEDDAPAVAAQQGVDPPAEDAAERPTGHHHAEDFGSMRFSKGPGQERNADDDLRASADTSKNRKTGLILELL
jgi:hypothetical protein